jgi:hypothetical protein
VTADRRPRVVVYGADSAGATVMYLALVCGWDIVRFVDDDPAAPDIGVGDVPVETTGTLLRRDFDFVIVAEAADRAAVTARLHDMGFAHGVSFFFADEPVVIEDLEVRLHIATVLRSGLRVVLFGTGEAGMIAKGLVLQRSWQIVYCVDNDPARWGRRFADRDIRSPQALRARDFDLVIICSAPGRWEIMEQLARMGLEHCGDYVDVGEL